VTAVKIAIAGYGKMGHMAESAAKRLGHEIVTTIDPAADDASVKISAGGFQALAEAVKQSGADGVIEFSHPSAAAGNIKALLPLGIPIVTGTTGWKESEGEIAALAEKTGGTVLRSANFSLGVNLFYKIVAEAARLLSEYDEYDCAVWEAHHNQKADSPSGSALEIARAVLASNHKKNAIISETLSRKPEPRELTVSSTRVGSVPGTHTVFFDSGADTIELTHRARNREGFASGAARALEKLIRALDSGALRRGALYSIEDVL
jgi:4-hydroxy-tetrahydrodipicolinate reductase